MKRIVNLLVLSVVAILMASCSTSYVSKVKPTEVRDVQFFEPVSSIELLESLNTPVLNDSINLRSNQIINDILRERTKQFPISGEILFNDNQKYQMFKREMLNLVTAISQDRGIENKIIPEVIEGMLNASGKRFGMVVVHTGFIRTLENYIANEAFERLKNATLNLPIVPTEKDRSSLYIMIFDALNRDIALFNYSHNSNASPLDRFVIRGQYKYILEDYFE